MKILVADDEYLARERMKEILGKVVPNAEVVCFELPSQVLAYLKGEHIDVAFLDIQMPGMSGMELAKKIKQEYPRANIVFCTGYDEYMAEAFAMYVSGYLLKPITADGVKNALDNLRYPPEMKSQKRLQVKCFGNFDVLVDGKPVAFAFTKTKELFAYLIDRRGAGCSNAEIMGVLWEDEEHTSYLKRIRGDLIDSMKNLGLEEVLVKRRGSLALRTDLLDCDYYRWIENDPAVVNLYQGEYMSQYSWAEYTNASLENML